MDPHLEKPLPEPTPHSQPFWDGMKAHRMVLQQCASCGKVRHYPRPVCDACFSMDVSWTEASGNGKVYSWAVSHHPFHPGFKRELPYIVLTVELDEGVRMVGQVEGISEEALGIGLPVQVDYHDVDENVTLPVFRPRTSS